MAGDLKFNILAKVSGVNAIDNLKKSVKGVEDNTRSMSQGMTGAAGAVKAFIGAFAVQQAGQFLKGLIDQADALGDLSQKTGVAVEDLTGFQAAAERAGLPMEGLTSGLKKLSLGLIEAKTGNKDMIGAFQGLGVAFKDATGNARPVGSVMKDISDKFANLKDGPEKAAIAVKLFGKSGADLIPMLNEGSESLTRFGVKISSDFAARADQFNDTLVEIGDNTKSKLVSGLEQLMPTLQELASAFLDSNKEGNGFIEFFKSLADPIRVIAVIFKGATTGVSEFFEVLKSWISTVGVTAISYFETFSDGIDSLKEKIDPSVSTAQFEKSEKIREAALKRRKENLLQSYGNIFDELAEKTNKSNDDFEKFYQKTMKNFGDAAGAKADTAPEKKKKRGGVGDVSQTGDEAKRYQNEIEAMKAYQAKSQASQELRKLELNSVNKSTLAFLKESEAVKLNGAAKETTAKFTEKGKKEYLAMTEIIIAQNQALIEQEYQQKRTWQYGAKDALKEYVENATNAAANVKAAFSKAFGAMEDTLVNFFKSGELNFKKFADTVIDEILRIVVRQQIIAPLVGAIGGAFSPSASAASGAIGSGSGYLGVNYNANGNVLSSQGVMSLQKYASGGIARTPQLAMFGEAGPEAFVPLPDGRSIPVSMKGGGGVNVSVSVNMQNGSADAKSDSNVGRDLGLAIASAVKSELINQRRPGGLLA